MHRLLAIPSRYTVSITISFAIGQSIDTDQTPLLRLSLSGPGSHAAMHTHAAMQPCKVTAYTKKPSQLRLGFFEFETFKD